jgi:hypothetical protein
MGVGVKFKKRNDGMREGNESMIFLGYSVSMLMGWCCASVGGGKIHYIIVYGVLLLFLHFPMRLGKNGFDCEQHGKARDRGKRERERGKE